MRKQFIALGAAALIASATPLCPSMTRPQEATKEKQSKEATAEPQIKVGNFYRVDYTLRELEHGKRTNTRNYTLKVEAGRGANFRVGSRIPVVTGQSPTGGPQFQYHDVGVNMDCMLREHEGFVWLVTKVTLSSVASSDSGAAASTPVPPPVVRNFSFEDSAVATLGKPALVGGIDDVTSDRRYEVEATVEKIR